MKLLYQLIGFLLVFCILAFSILFFIESNTNWLTGDFGDFVRSMHILYEEVKETVLSFLQQSGIAKDAADLMSAGAEKLRGNDNETIVVYSPTESPTVSTPQPTQIVIPVITVKP